VSSRRKGVTGDNGRGIEIANRLIRKRVCRPHAAPLITRLDVVDQSFIALDENRPGHERHDGSRRERDHFPGRRSPGSRCRIDDARKHKGEHRAHADIHAMVVPVEERGRGDEADNGGTPHIRCCHVPPCHPNRDRIEEQLRKVVRRRCGDDRDRHGGRRQRRDDGITEANGQMEADQDTGNDERPLNEKFTDEAISDRPLHGGRHQRHQRPAHFVEIAIRVIAGEDWRRFPEKQEIRVEQLFRSAVDEDGGCDDAKRHIHQRADTNVCHRRGNRRMRQLPNCHGGLHIIGATTRSSCAARAPFFTP
jgi:hypothetical protein